VRRELLVEGKKHQAWKRLCQIPSIGPIRAAVLLGILQTPHRFRTKRQREARTPDLRFRKPTLYPSELQTHFSTFYAEKLSLRILVRDQPFHLSKRLI
jgi:hypothetical protein